MKVLISVDMEGISGVATRRETATGWPAGAGKGNDYERARGWMTADANAAIAGACDAGATEILVADAHDGMLNLIWEDLDPRAELVNRLLEHEKFKAAAEMLWSRATVERAVFKRAEIETDTNNPEVAVGLFDLLRVFQEILARHKEEVMLEIEREEVTMAEMIERLRNMVRSAGELNLVTFFERAGSRRGLVVAFLSVLELVRMSEISLVQRETFGEIIARATNPA